MKPELRITLEAMLGELESSALVVVLAPAPDARHEGHCVRCVAEKNARWYRAFCAAFPSSRRRSRALADTAIRRRETVRCLAAMLAGERVGPVYGPRLLDAARAYWKRHADELEARLLSEAQAEAAALLAA